MILKELSIFFDLNCYVGGQRRSRGGRAFLSARSHIFFGGDFRAQARNIILFNGLWSLYANSQKSIVVVL
jgi:hypothetical protein